MTSVGCICAVGRPTNLEDVNGRSLIRKGLHDALRVAVEGLDQTLPETGRQKERARISEYSAQRV